MVDYGILTTYIYIYNSISMIKKFFLQFRHKILAAALLVILAVSSSLATANRASAQANDDFFPDTNNHWADPYAEALHDNCDIVGYKDASGNILHQFRADNQITRAELVTMIFMCSKINAGDIPNDQPFKDVPTDSWFFKPVAAAKMKGWIKGYADGTFKPNQPITREEALKVILLSKLSEQQIDDAVKGKTENFNDVNNNDWSWKYVVYAADHNYVKGYNDGGFHPKANVTRGEAAKIISTVYGFVQTGPVSETPAPTPSNPQPTNPTSYEPTPTQPVADVAVLGKCQVFPADNPWNTDISNYPVDPNSSTYIASILSNGREYLHADFGGNGEYGMPYVIVSGDQAKVPVKAEYADESDEGLYPIPPNPPIEGGSDKHILVVDEDNCMLYETWNSEYVGPGWQVGSAAIFDLTSNKLRPDGWTSADAAGLPVLPGLVRYDEVKSGAINHAVRFTVSKSQRAYIHPATHFASASTDSKLPPMGLRLRLKADFDTSQYTGQSRVILEALKKYGMIVADNGSDWFISGEKNTGWDDEDLNQLKTVPGSAFEAVSTGEIIK